MNTKAVNFRAAAAGAARPAGTGTRGALVFVTFSPQRPRSSMIQAVRRDGRLRTIFSAAREIDFPRWSPGARKIVFGMSAADGSYSNLYIVNARGTGLRRITTGHHFDVSPAWSPDGRKIAFASDRSGNWDIWLKNLMTGAVTRLTAKAATDWEPAWSPDGRSIAFASNRTGAFNIWAKNLATGRLRKLTSGRGDNEYPAWSRSGRQIAFASLRTGNWDIWRKNLVTANVTRLTRSNSTALDPTWSPDDRSIAFESDPHRAFFNIFVKSVRGTVVRRITNNAPTGSDSVEPDWARSW